ncbi:hypothetical protein SUGI_0067420 [Cryptomeria japonica]|nr:hypothetical protein SUGI_0067420 [Cryptomeria japonica]
MRLEARNFQSTSWLSRRHSGLHQSNASKGCLVSFISLHYDHTRIEKATQYPNRLNLAVPGLVRLEWIPDQIPPYVPIDHHINDFLFYHMHHTMTGHGLESLLLRFNASTNPVSCVLYDSFLPWVPMLTLEIWADQHSNSKCVVDVWKTGSRMKKGEDGVVGMKEIEGCVKSAMEGGEEFAESRKNSLRWKEAATRAMMPGGSSDANLSRFTRDLAAIAA